MTSLYSMRRLVLSFPGVRRTPPSIPPRGLDSGRNEEFQQRLKDLTELGSCSGTYGMGDLGAVQPLLVSPQNEGLEVLALVFLPVPGPDTGHELRPPQKRLPNLSLSLNERPCCWVLAVGLLRVQVRDSEIRSTHMVIRSASTMSCRAASLERPERNTPSPACVRSGV